MEEVSVQIDAMTSDRASAVVLDIERLMQGSDRSSGIPKMTKPLSRKGMCRAERLATAEEEGIDEASRKLLIKVNSQCEPLKQPSITGKSISPSTATTSCPNLGDSSDGSNKRFNHFMTMNPRKILFMFATMSSVGTLVLICFTLAITKQSDI